MNTHHDLMVTDDPRAVLDRPHPFHVAWLVDGDYAPVARQLVDRSIAAGRKTFAFGPLGGADLQALDGAATATADPAEIGLGGGPFDAAAMYATFHEQAALAREEGFAGFTVVADMDWLVPLAPTTADIVTFEAGLDRVVADLGASVVCAYRRRSFDATTLLGALAVHPTGVTADGEAPPFRLVAGGPTRWRLMGEVDLAVHDLFVAALRATAGDGRDLDISGLEFIDVAGMRAISRAAADEGPIVLHGAPRVFERAWKAAQFDSSGHVQLAS